MSQAAATLPVEPSPGLWATLREAVKGSHQDYTEAPVGRAVLLLAVPMVLEMLMESVFAVADIFFVGRLGADAVATVGITESLMTIVYAVAIGLSIGATATVARRIGEKDPDAAARAAVQAIVVGVLAGGRGWRPGDVTAPSLLRLMGASEAVVRTGASFTRVMLGASGSVLLLFLINAIFRGAGDAAIAMRVLWFGERGQHRPRPVPHLRPRSVSGARCHRRGGRHQRSAADSGVVYQLYRLTRGDSRIVLRARALRRWTGASCAAILRLSGVGIFQNFIATASWMGLVRILTGFGSAAVAGNTIGIRIIMFALLPSFGVSNAAATLVGQNLGAAGPTGPKRPSGVPGCTTRCAS